MDIQYKWIQILKMNNLICIPLIKNDKNFKKILSMLHLIYVLLINIGFYLN